MGSADLAIWTVKFDDVRLVPENQYLSTEPSYLYVSTFSIGLASTEASIEHDLLDHALSMSCILKDNQR